MRFVKDLLKRTIMLIILISLLISFLATPSSYAKLELEEDEFYYAGTTEGSYAPSFNIFSWLLNNIGDIADWLLGIITMGFRMVFVGWTALLEKLLTWALESTTGVTADGQLVGSSTDLTGLTDSSNNLTVEAIVYNKVAGLNIDFFDLEFDPTTTGTGKKLICGKCNKPVEECLTDDKVQPVIDAGQAYINAEKEYNEVGKTLLPSDIAGRQAAKDKLDMADADRKAAIKDVLKNSNCGCNNCDDCERYLIQLSTKEPLIIRLRKLVATWYTIIRLLAMAAMLIVLIAVGIKMALSTIASDKAVYKRMLVDWVVGVVIMFTIHYFMIFCIYMNGVIVKVIEDSAQSINKVQMQQLSDSDTEITNAELEIKVYEEVRTRAYDARLINGLTGMVMYMTLVFFAFKYTLIYLKRLLTILVLTLMGPGVGVAYALQKAMTGKSSALKTWMAEYIMNVIIQIVHALMYAIFISQAMVLSLQSVAGMIIALILMNYTSKADTLFKKIFKFGGADSLVGHTANAMESSLQGLQTAKGIVTGAKPAAKILTNTPYAKTLKGLGKAAAAAGIGVARLARNAGSSVEEKYEREVDKEMDKNGEGSAFKRNDDGSDAETEEQYDARRAKAMEAVNARWDKKQLKKNPNRDLDNALKAEGGDKLRMDLQMATKALNDVKDLDDNDPKKKAAMQQHLEAIEKYNRFQQINIPTTGDIAKSRVKRIIDLENVFENTDTRNPWKLTFGTTKFNPKTFRFENDGNGIYRQLTPTNILGLTDTDKDKMKAITGSMGKALLGMGGIFVGMASFVAEPKKAMTLMAVGKVGVSKVFGKDKRLSSKKGKYKFSAFGSGSINAIRNSALVRARQEHDALVAGQITTQHPQLAERLKNGSASAITIGQLGGELGALFATENSPYSAIATSAMIAEHGSRRKTKFMKNTALGGMMDDFAKHYVRQQRKQITQFNNDALGMQQAAVEARIEYRNEKKDREELEILLEEQGYQLDKNGDLIEVDSKPKEEDDIYKIVLLAAEKELEEIRKTGTEVDENTTMKKYDIEKDDVVDTIGTKQITQADIKLLNKTIDEILMKISEGKEVDISSEKAQDDVIRLLSTELGKTGLLSAGQNADDLFKQGREGLKKELKKKAAKRNTAVKAATKKLEAVFTPEGASAISGMISEVAQESVDKGKNPSEIPVSDIISRLNKSKDGSLQIKGTDGSVSATITDRGSKVKKKDGSRKIATNDDKLTSEQLQTLEQFMQVTRAITADNIPVTRKVEKKKAERIIANAIAEVNDSKDKKAQKLQQAMLAIMGEEKAVKEETVGTKKPSTQDILAQLSKQDQDYVTATVKDLLELKEINKESQRLNIDKVSKKKPFAQYIEKESTARIDIATMQKQIVMEEMSERKSKDVIEKLQSDIEKRKNDLKVAEAQTTINGPFIDINQYVRQGFTRDNRKRENTDESSVLKEKLLANDVAKRMKKKGK